MSFSRHFTALAVAFGFAAHVSAGPLDPPAPPAPTAALADCIPLTAIPVTIDSPGSYCLVSDLSMTENTDGIVITTSNVTVDLNGFTLFGQTGATQGSGILASPPTPSPLERIVVRNGRLLNWRGSGIDLEEANQCAVEDIQVEFARADGIRVGSQARIERCTVVDCFEIGIVGVIQCLVSDCIALNNESDGIQVSANSVVRNCTSRDNSGDGYFIGDTSVVENCVAFDNGDNGFITSGNCTFFNVVSRFNAGDGISASGGTSVRGCTLDGNVEFGVRISGDSIVSDCVVTSNDLGGISVGSDCLVTRNSVSDNATLANGPGIDIGNSQGCRVESNHLSGNGQGVVLTSGEDNFIIRNSAVNHGENEGYVLGSGTNFVGTILNTANTTNANANFEF